MGVEGAPSPDVVVRIRDLTVRYPGRDRDALRGVVLGLRPGEVVGLVGANGSGRSTLCRVLNGIVPQVIAAEVAGDISVGGLDPRRVPVATMARIVGMAFDDPAAQLAQPTVADEVALAMESMALPQAAMADRMAALLGALGLDGLGDREPGSLSGGQQQRVLLASALALRPRLLVLDEATVALDPAGRADVLALVARLAAEEGTAVVVVEHDTELLAARVDRVVALVDGEVAADGAPGTVLSDVSLLARAGVRVPDVAVVVAAVRPGDATPPPVLLADGIVRLGGPA